MKTARNWHIYWRPVSGGWWRRWPGDHATRATAIHAADRELRGIARARSVANLATGERWDRRGGSWFKSRAAQRVRRRAA